MSKYTLNTLKKFGNLTDEKIAEILKTVPDTLQPVYWHSEINLFYIAGRRRNALVFCNDISDWRTSTRYNEELTNIKMFIPVDDLKELFE